MSNAEMQVAVSPEHAFIFLSALIEDTLRSLQSIISKSLASASGEITGFSSLEVAFVEVLASVAGAFSPVFLL